MHLSLCGLVAALTTLLMVGATMHRFMDDLHRQARWLLGGARFAVFESLLTLIAHIWPLLRE